MAKINLLTEPFKGKKTPALVLPPISVMLVVTFISRFNYMNSLKDGEPSAEVF